MGLGFRVNSAGLGFRVNCMGMGFRVALGLGSTVRV